MNPQSAMASACIATCLAFVPIVPARASGFQVLYSFTDGTDGGQPDGGVIQDASGTLYGETFSGGASSCTDKVGFPKTGCGTVYSFTSAAGLKVLVTFTGPNGSRGNNPLTLVGNTLYGSTVYGGADNDGVLFSVHTDGSDFTLLHQFSGADGSQPIGALVPGPNGVLYGLTENGGAGVPTTSAGVLFEISSSGAYTVLHSFAGGAGGASPSVILRLSSGVLVGSTLVGGIETKNVPAGQGTFFSYAPSTNQFSVLFSMPGSGVDGENPYLGSVGPGPTLYAADNDTVFSLDQKNGYTLLGQFTGTTTADSPYSGPLYRPNQPLIGTLSGGPYNGYGSVYEASGGTVTDLYYFGGTPDGGAPLAQPVIESSGAIIGTASIYGTCYYCGTIWEYTP